MFLGVSALFLENQTGQADSAPVPCLRLSSSSYLEQVCSGFLPKKTRSAGHEGLGMVLGGGLRQQVPNYI